MELQNISIDDDAETDIVQFLKHVEENLDPNEEFDCKVWLETVRREDIDDMPGSDIPSILNPPEKTEYGVHLYVQFGQNSDCPNHEFTTLAKKFFGETNYTVNGGFNGKAGEYNGYVFKSKE